MAGGVVQLAMVQLRPDVVVLVFVMVMVIVVVVVIVGGVGDVGIGSVGVGVDGAGVGGVGGAGDGAGISGGVFLFPRGTVRPRTANTGSLGPVCVGLSNFGVPIE